MVKTDNLVARMNPSGSCRFDNVEGLAEDAMAEDPAAQGTSDLDIPDAGIRQEWHVPDLCSHKAFCHTHVHVVVPACMAHARRCLSSLIDMSG